MRDKLPGETDPFEGTRNAPQYLSRIVRGQFTSPDTTNGRTQVQTNEVFSVRDATIPVLWMSNKGVRSAWGRYMPFGGENVHIAYRNDSTPVVVGYDANAPGEQGIQEGWPFLNSLHEDQAAGYSSFKVLKPGEYDFKSSGDAYIHGTSDGTLFLAGGQSFIRLRKQSYTIESKASAYKYNSETTTYRLGTVFREETENEPEVPINSGSLKEFLVDVNVPVPNVGTPSSQSVGKLHIGNIVDDSNTEEDSPFGAPLRYRLSLGDSTYENEVFSMLIDSNGDIEIKQLKPVSEDDNTLSWQVGDTTLTVNGSAGEFFVEQNGVATVSVAIADHLEQLWSQLKSGLDTFETHSHPAGSLVAPNGAVTGTTAPSTTTISAPSWDSNINSNKFIIPDN